MIYSLDDEELRDLMTLAAPLPAHARAPFVEAVLEAATKQGGEIGAGTLHRIGAGLQRSFALPPIGHQRGPAPRRSGPSRHE
jgi:hypothetical protein